MGLGGSAVRRAMQGGACSRRRELSLRSSSEDLAGAGERFPWRGASKRHSGGGEAPAEHKGGKKRTQGEHGEQTVPPSTVALKRGSEQELEGLDKNPYCSLQLIPF